MAEPLYALADLTFGTHDKKLPGMRQFLQTVGQWGRGTINAEYPLTPERSTFVAMCRCFDNGWFGVQWENYGRDTGIWVKAADERATAQATASGGRPLVIPNIRFADELDFFNRAGWINFHVTCSLNTLLTRRAAAGYTTAGAADISEELAMKRDAAVRENPGHAVALFPVIWNDPAPPACEGMFTLDTFKTFCEGAAQ